MKYPLLPGMLDKSRLLHEIDCTCGRCETLRTCSVSPATAEHVFGEFDVELAREQAMQEKAAKAPPKKWWQP